MFSDDSVKDLLWLVGILLIIAVVWYFTGGPMRQAAKKGPFIEKPASFQTGNEKPVKASSGTASAGTSGQQTSTGTNTTTGAQSSTYSIYKGNIKLSTASSKSTKPEEEYVEISATDKVETPVNISSWTITGTNGLSLKIGQGSYLPAVFSNNVQEDILLIKSSKAIVTTGRGVMGTGFKLNKCIGYLTQYKTFIPSLSSSDCPAPKNEVIPKVANDACLDYIDNLPKCRVPSNIPSILQYQCRDFVTERINYVGCVNAHKNDKDFYQKQWRVFLNRDTELWKNKRETITLRDSVGKIVDEQSY